MRNFSKVTFAKDEDLMMSYTISSVKEHTRDRSGLLAV